MERATGIEPVSEAWKASILPLYDARSFTKLIEEGADRQEFVVVRVLPQKNFQKKMIRAPLPDIIASLFFLKTKDLRAPPFRDVQFISYS